jgi:predicted nucleic-acid-binding protein
VLCEVVWVLETSYDVPRAEIVEIAGKLLRARHLTFRDADVLARVVRAFEKGKGDFADYLIGADAKAAGADAVATFDRALWNEPGFRRP